MKPNNNIEAIKSVFGEIGANNADDPRIKFDITEQTIEYTLKKPIEIGGKEKLSIKLSEPTVKAMAAENMRFKSDGSFDMEQSINMIAACSGEFKSVVELIKARDAMKLTELCASFFT